MRILARYMLSASDASHFPPPSLPEIAFLGRSNVGKSSVINSLVGTKLARTSSTPGRTRSINFFEIRRAGQPKPEFLFTDLPGYGYPRFPARSHRNGPALSIHISTSGPLWRSALRWSMPTSRRSKATGSSSSSWPRWADRMRLSPPSATACPATRSRKRCENSLRSIRGSRCFPFPQKPARARKNCGNRSVLR